jgi:hypothetical protein
MKSTMLLAVWLLCCACPVPAPVMATDDHCDRAKRYEALSAQVQQTLQGNTVLLEVHTHTGSAYHMGYVYTLVPYPPEFVMAVFTNYAEQRGHITDVREAKVEVQHGNYARVRFVYDLPWPLPHSEYVVNDTVRQEEDTYLLSWDLHPSSPKGLSAPQYVEGYFRTQPVGPRTLIIYCNYVIPGSGLLPGLVNKAGLKAMRTTIDDTVRWVTATAASSETSSRRIAQLRAMLAP